MAITELKPELDGSSKEEEKLSPLPPIYEELLALAPEDADFGDRGESVQMPSSENKDTYLHMAVYLKERFQDMNEEEKLQYLGMLPIKKGAFQKGTDNPIPDRREGNRFEEAPARQVEVPYDYTVSSYVVPNILYEIGIADMGGYQVRVAQSPSHLHPAVNTTQGNSVTFLKWLSKVADMELRLPTEDEWEKASFEASDGKEFTYGSDSEIKGKVVTFDANAYHAEPINAANNLSPINGMAQGGNVWEMATPSLEQDFLTIPPSDDGLIDGSYFFLKAGGFQHCNLGPRHATRMISDPLMRSTSTGFRMAHSESLEQNDKGGWRKKTETYVGNSIFKETGYSRPSVQIVQSRNVNGLSFINNGSRIDVKPESIASVQLPVRANGLEHWSKRLYIYQTEHILAALSGKGIWDAQILLNGGNALPAGDFSATKFVEMINNAKLRPGTDRELVVKDEISFEYNGSGCTIKPGKTNFKVSVNFPNNPFIGKQDASFNPAADDFDTQIAPARTFIRGLTDEEAWADVRRIAMNGLPDFENIKSSPILVATENGWNMDLRFPNEPARHKLLDVMGDLALLGYPIKGEISIDKPGHEFNLQLAKELAKMVQEGDTRVEMH